ncbi:putative RNA-directed DNA polymerase [Helianthus anomalus]
MKTVFDELFINQFKGVRSSRKSDWIRGLKTSYGIHFLAIQETKLQVSETFRFNQFWGRAEFKVAVVDSQGRSGGRACLWSPTVFRCVDTYYNRHFIIVSGFLVQSGCKINLVNVYAPNDAISRRGVWMEIMGFRNSLQGLWVMMGDFNDVRDESERMNSEFVEANARAFNDFIIAAGLVEYNMGGGNFTYISDNGKKLSKLDRFLVCLGFRENWPNASVVALAREVSDHRPIVLSTVQSDFGHIPFRFFNSWFEFPGFPEFVLRNCGAFQFAGPGDLALAIKFRWLKDKIKSWLKLEKERRDGIYGGKKRRLEFIENMAEERILEEDELAERAECRNYVAEFERIKQLDLRQKSRSKWAIDGDENTAFFHHIVNSNISSNRLNGLLIDGVWNTNPLAIKEVLYEFFHHQFSEPMPIRPELLCSNIATISDHEVTLLENPFSVEEIKEAVWECEGERAPGPDGFNFKFIKRCWVGLRDDMVRLFNKFYEEGSINKSCTSSFIALIPKVNDPVSPTDFRPISLIGVINKVISKVLVNRLKSVMGKLISEQQSAFLAGRNIMDGPLILNEVFGSLKKLKRCGMFFKVDINKAYDSVNWSFLNSIMAQMNFPSRWRSWVMATLYSARASVLINGSPTREFDCSRGLRQGDPLSPFLFVIVMEALTCVMNKETSIGLFNGINVFADGPLLSHLFYADDLMFISEWSTSNINNLRRILRCFYLASGLKVNLAKCSIYGIGVGDQEVQQMASYLRCKKVVWAIHHKSRVWNDFPVKVSIVGPWKAIMSIKPILLGAGLDLSGSIYAVPGNGENVQFWLDAWADSQPFYIRFPNLFKVETNKMCMLADRMTIGEVGPVFSWAWAQPELDGICQNQLLQLVSLVNGLNMGLGRDLWKWQNAPDEGFCVAGIKKILGSANRVAPARVFKWNNWVPKKVSIVAWRAAMERLPTKCALAIRNISVQNNLCALCGDYVETSEHLFVACQFAQIVWQNIADWCNTPPIYAFELNDVLSTHETCSGNSSKKKGIHALVLVTIWSLWKLRNDSVFNNSVPHTTKILDEIKAMSFLWVKNRAKMVSLTWRDWSRFAF